MRTAAVATMLGRKDAEGRIIAVTSTLVGEGKANKEIARELGIGERTARTHVSSALRKLQLSSRTQLALWAVGERLVSVETSHRSAIVD